LSAYNKEALKFGNASNLTQTVENAKNAKAANAKGHNLDDSIAYRPI